MKMDPKMLNIKDDKENNHNQGLLLLNSLSISR